MGEFEFVIPEIDGEEKLIGAANYIAQELGFGRDLSKEARKVLSDLLKKLSRVVTIDDRDEEEDEEGEIEQRLNVLIEKIMNREADESMIWDSDSDEGNEYLDAVNELIALIKRLDRSSGFGKTDSGKLLLRKAHDALQTAMARLEDEFTHVLVENTVPFEHEHAAASFRSSEAAEAFAEEEGSVASFGAASTDDSRLGGSSRRISGEAVIDLVSPEAVPDLKKIADAMVSAGYGRECVHRYTMVRKDVLDGFLCDHEIEKMSIEDVLRMDWSILNSYIKKWVRVMRSVVRVYLVSEKWLENQVFGDRAETGSACFVDTVKAPVMQLLNFGEAVSLGPRQPEKLLKILEMHELVSEHLPDIDALFSDDAAGSAVVTEYQHVTRRLGDCARSTFLEFKNAIASDVSSHPLPGGGVHLLTNYVMNYLMALTDFSETFDLLLREHDGAAANLTPPPSPDTDPVTEEEGTGQNSPSSGKFAAMTRHFFSITSVLEANLQEKSRLYRDAALQHFFLLNNVHYMTRKVINSELKGIFGNKWTRNHTWKFQQHAKEYERATWCPVLALLKDKGASPATASSGSGSRGLSPKERFQSFNAAFEEVYKAQTGWIISDEGLREELRTSVSQWVIQAYWTFYSSYKNTVSERYIKYSTDDLQKLLLDLFSGSPKSLGNSYRR